MFLKILNSVNLERKALLKKIKALQEDKKTDPDVITRQENLLVEVEDKKLRALLATTRVRAMTKLSVEYFKMDPNFDYKEKYAQVKNGTKNIIYIILFLCSPICHRCRQNTMTVLFYLPRLQTLIDELGTLI